MDLSGAGAVAFARAASSLTAQRPPCWNVEFAVGDVEELAVRNVAGGVLALGVAGDTAG